MKKKLKRSANTLIGWHDGLKGIQSPYLRGDVSYLSGNVDDCEITDEDRAKGININTLIAEKP